MTRHSQFDRNALPRQFAGRILPDRAPELIQELVSNARTDVSHHAEMAMHHFKSAASAAKEGNGIQFIDAIRSAYVEQSRAVAECPLAQQFPFDEDVLECMNNIWSMGTEFEAEIIAVIDSTGFKR